MSTTVVYKEDSGKESILKFDAITSEDVDDTSTLTSYPVELGAPVTDHVVDNNETFSLSVKMTNAPMHGESYVTGEKIGSINTIKLTVPKYHPLFLPTPGAISGAVTGAVKGAVSSLIGHGETPEQATILIFSKPFNFVSEMFAKLKEIKKKRLVCRIVTSIYDHDNMILIGVHRARSSPEDAAVFDLTFGKLNTVETLRVAAAIPAEPRGKNKKKGGVKNPKPASEGQKKKVEESVARALFGGNIFKKSSPGGAPLKDVFFGGI